MRSKLNVLGVYAGSGIILLPFLNSKQYTIVGNIEYRSDYYTPNNVQWEDNFDCPVWNSKGKEVDLSSLGKVDIVVGHPTCGHSSALAYSRAKKLGDPKNDASIMGFIHTVNKLKPKSFMFENLPDLFKNFSEKEFTACFPDYYLVVHKSSVANYGNSQISRVRLIIVGVLKSLRHIRKYFKLPELDYGNLKTSGELLANLKYPSKSLCHIREPITTVVCMEKDFVKLNLRQIKEIWQSDEYIGRKKWDATTTGKGRMKNLPGVYRNLEDTYPLTARKQDRQFNHNGDIMSPRELARIQGIPDEFKIHYEDSHSNYWIKKGRVTVCKCPPYEVGLWYMKRLKRVIKLELI